MSPEETKSIIKMAGTQMLDQMPEVEALLNAFSASADGVTRLSEVQKRLARKMDTPVGGAEKIAALVNNRFAKFHLRWPATGESYYFAACRVGDDSDDANDDPVLWMYWRHSDKPRKKANAAAIKRVQSRRAEQSKQLRSSDKDRGATADCVAASGCRPESSDPRYALDLILQQYQFSAADDWLQQRAVSPAVLQNLIERIAGSIGKATPATKTFIRCLPLRSWCIHAATWLVAHVGQAVGHNCARAFSIAWNESPRDVAARVATADEQHATVFILAVEGYRPVAQICEIAENVQRSHPSCAIIVLGYATSMEMKRLPDFDLLQVASWSGARGFPNLYVPVDLGTWSLSPVTRLCFRPECRPSFPPAINKVTTAGSPQEGELWRLIVDGVRVFLESNVGGADIRDLACCWAERFSRELPDRCRDALYRSGIMFPELKDIDQRPTSTWGGMVAGAVSAYLDGLCIAQEDRTIEPFRSLFNATVQNTRTSRRLPFEASQTLDQKTSWLALVFAVCEATDRVASELINELARVDANLAFDLFAVRHGVRGGLGMRDTLVDRLLRLAESHSNGLPIPFRWRRMDPEKKDRLAGTDLSSDGEAARAIVEAMPDIDVLGTCLASCAVAAALNGERTHRLMDHWVRVAPGPVQISLQELGKALRASVIEIPSSVAGKRVFASSRPITVPDLLPIFPGFGRSQWENMNLALFSWVTAHLIARACGGRLPTEREFRFLGEQEPIQRAMRTSITQFPPLQAWIPSEWLDPTVEGSDGAKIIELDGRAFEGEWPRLNNMMVGRAAWEFGTSERRFLRAKVNPMVVSAAPAREKLAGCRVVFERPSI